MSQRTMGNLADRSRPDYWPKKIRDLEAAVRRLRTVRTLSPASFSVTASPDATVTTAQEWIGQDIDVPVGYSTAIFAINFTFTGLTGGSVSPSAPTQMFGNIKVNRVQTPADPGVSCQPCMVTSTLALKGLSLVQSFAGELSGSLGSTIHAAFIGTGDAGMYPVPAFPAQLSGTVLFLR